MEFATFVFLAISFVHELPVQAQPGAWLTNPPLKATHFWDCSGAACDATTLKPWDPAKYRYSPMYAPLNPTDYGGSKYGEKMWMTGAANDYLSDLMGSDAACCGKDGVHIFVLSAATTITLHLNPARYTDTLALI